MRKKDKKGKKSRLEDVAVASDQPLSTSQQQKRKTSRVRKLLSTADLLIFLIVAGRVDLVQFDYSLRLWL